MHKRRPSFSALTMLKDEHGQIAMGDAEIISSEAMCAYFLADRVPAVTAP
jgi:hypothetical protein